MTKTTVTIKSAHPELYGDLEVECKLLANDEIKGYVESIPEERKLTGYKATKVKAELGTVGETVSTVLTTIINGREYILDEETNSVKERTYETKETGKVTSPDVIVTNISSTSNERYIVQHEKFMSSYYPAENIGEYYPAYEPRELAQVSENIVITTAWGAKAICLAGSYIVTYNASKNDYNTLEQDAFKSTYKTVEKEVKTKTKKC